MRNIFHNLYFDNPSFTKLFNLFLTPYHNLRIHPMTSALTDSLVFRCPRRAWQRSRAAEGGGAALQQTHAPHHLPEHVLRRVAGDDVAEVGEAGAVRQAVAEYTRQLLRRQVHGLHREL